MDTLNDIRIDISSIKEQQSSLAETMRQQIQDYWTFKKTIMDRLNGLPLRPSTQTPSQLYNYPSSAEATG